MLTDKLITCDMCGKESLTLPGIIPKGWIVISSDKRTVDLCPKCYEDITKNEKKD